MSARKLSKGMDDAAALRNLTSQLREAGAHVDVARAGGGKTLRVGLSPTGPFLDVAIGSESDVRAKFVASFASGELLELARLAAEARRTQEKLKDAERELYRRSAAVRNCGVPFAIVDELGQVSFETEAWRSAIGEHSDLTHIETSDVASTFPIANDVTLDVEPILDASGRRVGSIVRAVTPDSSSAAETNVVSMFRRAVYALEGALTTSGVRVETRVRDAMSEIEGDLDRFAEELLELGLEVGSVSAGQTLMIELLRDPDPCVEIRIAAAGGSARRIGIESAELAR